MRRTVLRGALIAALLGAGCAVRPPVVSSPAFPDYLYPTVPAELRGSESARHLDDAWAFFQAGDLATAERRYVALVESRPGFYPATTGLGWLHLARGDARGAADHFDRAVTQSADYLPAIVGHGESMLALDDSEAAIRSFERALAIDAGLSHLQRVVAELRFTLVSQRIAQARESAAAGRLPDARSAYEQLIASSPDSAFLHLELGQVESELGDTAAALGHARRASELDPSDPAAFRLEGALHERSGDLEAAIAAYERADSLDPSDETARQLERLREQLRLAALPPEIQAIPTRPAVTRGELAALIGTRFPNLLSASASEGRTVIVTDTRGHWAQRWILDVTRAGVMEVDAAYRFDPARTVRRADLAETVGALLDLFEAGNSEAAGRWSRDRPAFSDMSSSHLSYPFAARAVSAGVLPLLDGQSFRPTEVVDGAGAVRAMNHLADLAREDR
ncbi:MAG: tetratricopeptide repeat protein [Acidobacteria bacterium]|nr:tetratricopeptide repeat protein [Acidobacteriota bacterium]